jgi:DNA-directed RNA polymerase subunit RPC12/RpoP
MTASNAIFGTFSFRVELSIACPRCDHPVPVDGPVFSAHCIHCQHDLDITEEYWTDHLREACKDMQNTPLGQGSGSMMFGTNTGNLTLGRLDPYCDNCKTNFINPWELKPGTVYTCGKCGSKWPVDAPPPWLSNAVPGVILLINALLETDKNESNPLSGSRAVSVSCPSCSGNLSVDGSSRLVRCTYCDTQVYLPDELWVRLHGVKRKRRWFVVCAYRNEK